MVFRTVIIVTMLYRAVVFKDLMLSFQFLSGSL